MQFEPARISQTVLLGALVTLAGAWPGLGIQAAGDAKPALIAAADAELGAGAITVRLRIASDAYLLASKLRFETDDSGVELGVPTLPPAESLRDPFVGVVEVYRGEVDLSVPYRAGAQAPARISLTIVGQGCTRSGDCYPAEIRTEAVRSAPTAARERTSVVATGTDDAGAVPSASETASAESGGLSKIAPALSGLLGLGQGIQIGASGQDEFLDPDVAFVLNASAAGPDAIEARWDIAEGYYIYRDRIQFGVPQGSGATLGEAGFPKGKLKDDEYFGPMEVYYDSVAALVPVALATGGAVDVDITYQGCAEAGLCYPPITKTVSLLLPAAQANTGAGPGSGASSFSDIGSKDGTAGQSNLRSPRIDADALGASGLRDSGTTTGVPSVPELPGRGAEATTPLDLPEQDRVAAALMSGNRWLVILSLFGAGLLLTFTPCVLPMVPILTSIIVGRGSEAGSGAGSTRRAFTLSLVYVLAMALTYTVAGVMAGLFGANLAAVFQDPWILSAFAGVFVLLSLSMFGFYDLQIPASWQARLAAVSHRQRGGTYVGVGVMGALSALIVGPCVAAPLAGVLIYIGQTGDPVLGGVALFALGMGMGVPLMVAGVSAGKLLPKAGAWMNAVKAVFGVMLLAVAIYLLERVVPESVALLLWAALFIVCAIYMGAFDALTPDSGGWRRLWKGAGLVMLVYGVLLVVGVAGGGGDLFRPLKGVGMVAGERDLEFRQVKGLGGLNAELESASARGQVVMFDFYADWCVSCKEMERFTFSDPAVQAAFSNVLLLQTDVTANDALDQALLAEFDLFGPPAILFFGPDGRERRELRVIGYMNASGFRQVAERATAPTRSIVVSRQDMLLEPRFASRALSGR